LETFSESTRAETWLRAARSLLAKKERIYNLIAEVREPHAANAMSRSIEDCVDEFLKKHERQSIHTVAETIFPAVEYRSGGLARVYDYPRTIFPTIQRLPANSKGTYALRLVERIMSDGKPFNPLDYAIEKLRKQLRTGHAQRAVYELDTNLEPLELKLYDIESDHANVRGGQCLSHISLKLGPDRELYLTALYRYQYFIQKALGNYKGLARLQACIAKEVGVPIGPLVCHATLAILEDKAVGESWGRNALVELINDCNTIQKSSAPGGLAA